MRYERHYYNDLEFERNTGEPTKYNLDIYDGQGQVFIISESPTNQGLPIDDTLLLHEAERLAEHYESHPSEMRLFAQSRDGDFKQYNFKEYQVGSLANPEQTMDFKAGSPLFSATRDEVQEAVSTVKGENKTLFSPPDAAPETINLEETYLTTEAIRREYERGR